MGLEKDEDLDADMYEFVIGYLKENGYHHYEISNFAKPGWECQHNINYWQNGQYLGFGLGAVSHIRDIRIKNTENMDEYLKGNFNTISEKLVSDKKTSENLMLGLRLIDGIKISEEVKTKFFQQISKLKNSFLLTEQNNLLKLTDKGLLMANYVFCEFL
ncbi:MAG: hypothetical protein AB1349_06100 [Elusimicrobiota bacterium]